MASLCSTGLASALAFLVAALVANAATGSTNAFYLKEGDRVVFYGDSITDQRLYTTYIETFVLTRFLALNVTFTHSGWGGDKVSGGEGGPIALRLERDVFAYDPTVVTLMLGMNDAGYTDYNQDAFNAYKDGLVSIVKTLRTRLPDVRLTLIRPSPYDDITRSPDPKIPGGYNSVLIRYGDTVAELAAAIGQCIVDFNTPLVELLKKGRAINYGLAVRIINDRVHPRDAGQIVMAAALLKSWNAPGTVSEVTLDLAARRVALADNTRITSLDANADATAIAWTQLDNALPMPGDASSVTAFVLQASGLTDTLNRQILRIAPPLPQPVYDLYIDGQFVAILTTGQLAAGVNLAPLPTPMHRQAGEVHKLTLQRAAIHQTRWRNAQVPLANARTPAIQQNLPDILKTLDEADAATARLQRAAAQPVARRYELKAHSPARLASELIPPGQPASLTDALGPNLALNKKWVSSNPNALGWDRGLTDGIWTGASGTVYSTNEQPAFPKHVTVDLEAPLAVGRVLTGVPAYGSTKTVTLSLSADGQNFTEVGRHVFSPGHEETCLFDFVPVTARYVRLTYLDHHDAQPDGKYLPTFAFTTDLQVFAPAR
ncbi:lysophospholipase L1-like esterase [Opitutaceae bacterium TAV1]|nr:lysophospholipase L1-like esterase [Opitutaceae bacterium TAV1]